MSFGYYNKIISSKTEDELVEVISDSISFFEDQLAESSAELKISGNYEKISSMLPGIFEFRYGQLQEVEAILNFLNLKKEKEFNKKFKHFLEAYNKTLSSRDAEKYANGTQEVYELSILINQISLIRNHYLGLTKAFDMMGWQLGHLVKLKVAGMEDYFIVEK